MGGRSHVCCGSWFFEVFSDTEPWVIIIEVGAEKELDLFLVVDNNITGSPLDEKVDKRPYLSQVLPRASPATILKSKYEFTHRIRHTCSRELGW